MCGVKGLRVSSKTVEHLSTEKIESCSYDLEIFSLCLDPGCEMAYFSADYGYLIFQSHLKVELDHKEGVQNPYICYCHKIDYKTLKRKVQREGLREFKELFESKEKIIVEKCKLNNPFDCSCVADIQKYIEIYLSEMKTNKH